MQEDWLTAGQCGGQYIIRHFQQWIVSLTNVVKNILGLALIDSWPIFRLIYRLAQPTLHLCVLNFIKFSGVRWVRFCSGYVLLTSTNLYSFAVFDRFCTHARAVSGLLLKLTYSAGWSKGLVACLVALRWYLRNNFRNLCGFHLRKVVSVILFLLLLLLLSPRATVAFVNFYGKFAKLALSTQHSVSNYAHKHKTLDRSVVS